MKKLVIIVSVAIVLFGVFFGAKKVLSYVVRKAEMNRQERIALPEPEVRSSSSSSSVMVSSESSSASIVLSHPVRASVNWDVPFTPQAPLANWDELHEEACEEASVLMVLRYFQGQAIGSPEDAEKEIQRLVARNAELGFSVDDTAEEVKVLLLDQDPSLRVELLRDPTIEDLQKELSDGALIIVPAQGQFLKNPYFTAPGPRYHMLVLRGYTDDGYVITNDPGTKRGKEYVYPWERLLFAIHDWNDGNVEEGAKVVVVVRR